MRMNLFTKDGKLVVRDGKLKVTATDPADNCCCEGEPCNNCEGTTPRFITVGIYDLLPEAEWYTGCTTKSMVEGEYEIEQLDSSSCSWRGEFLITEGCPAFKSLHIVISASVVDIFSGSTVIGTRLNVSISLSREFAVHRISAFQFDKLYEAPEDEEMDCISFGGVPLESFAANPMFGGDGNAEISIGGPSYITLTGHN